jgi:hypothetical protein
LECHERGNTTQKSIGKEEFTSEEGCATDKEVQLASTPSGKSTWFLS